MFLNFQLLLKALHRLFLDRIPDSSEEVKLREVLANMLYQMAPSRQEHLDVQSHENSTYRNSVKWKMVDI